jgi:hypothetical protein
MESLDHVSRAYRAYRGSEHYAKGVYTQTQTSFVREEDIANGNCHQCFIRRAAYTEEDMPTDEVACVLGHG